VSRIAKETSRLLLIHFNNSESRDKQKEGNHRRDAAWHMQQERQQAQDVHEEASGELETQEQQPMMSEYGMFATCLSIFQKTESSLFMLCPKQLCEPPSSQ
jgi:hypothetical protein